MNLPETKYKIGDKIYIVKGLGYAGFVVKQIIFTLNEAGRVDVEYEGVNIQNEKQKVKAKESDLYQDFSDVKAVLYLENKRQSEIIAETIDKAQDPYNPISEKPTQKNDS